MAPVEKGRGAFWRASSALFVGRFVIFATLYCTQPLMPVFSEEFGVSPAVASLSLLVTTATLSVSMLFAAALSDSRGRKIIIVASLLLSALLALLVAASPGFPSLLGGSARCRGWFLQGCPLSP